RAWATFTSMLRSTVAGLDVHARTSWTDSVYVPPSRRSVPNFPESSGVFELHLTSHGWSRQTERNVHVSASCSFARGFSNDHTRSRSEPGFRLVTETVTA